MGTLQSTPDQALLSWPARGSEAAGTPILIQGCSVQQHCGLQTDAGQCVNQFVKQKLHCRMAGSHMDSRHTGRSACTMQCHP